MAQPHKGDRKQIAATLDPAVKAAILTRAQSLGVPTSDYVAGLAALYYGRPDLAGPLAQHTLAETSPAPAAMWTRRSAAASISPRFPTAIYAAIRRHAGQRGIPMGYLIDEICAAHVGGRVAHHSAIQEDLLTSA